MLGFFLHHLSTGALAATVYVGTDESIQSAMNDASPGDTIVLAAGTYSEDLSTEVPGTEDAPITVMSGDDGRATITALGEVLQIDHPHWIFEDLVFDGQFGDSDIIDINDAADHTRLSNVVVQRQPRLHRHGRPLTCESDSEIHSCLWFDDDEEEPRVPTESPAARSRISRSSTHPSTGCPETPFSSTRAAAPGWNSIVINTAGCMRSR